MIRIPVKQFDFESDPLNECEDLFRFIASVILVEKLTEFEDQTSFEILNQQKNLLEIIYFQLKNHPESFRVGKDFSPIVNLHPLPKASTEEAQLGYEAVKNAISIEKRQNKISFLKERIEWLEKDLKIVQNDLIDSENQKKEQQDENSELTKKIRDLEEMKTIQSEYIETTMKKTFRKTFEDSNKIHDLETTLEFEISEKKKIQKLFDDKIIVLENQRNEDSETIKNLEKANSQKVVELTRISEELENFRITLENERKSNKKNMEDLQIINSELEENIESLGETNDRLSEKLKIEEQKNEEFCGKVKHLNTIISDNNYLIDQQKEFIESLEEDKKQLNSNISKLDKKVISEKSKNQEMSKKVQEKESILESLRIIEQTMKDRIEQWIKIHEIDVRIKERMEDRLRIKNEKNIELEERNEELKNILAESLLKKKEIMKELEESKKFVKLAEMEKEKNMKIIEKQNSLRIEIENLKISGDVKHDEYLKNMNSMNAENLKLEKRINDLLRNSKEKNIQIVQTSNEKDYFEKLYSSQLQNSKNLEIELRQTLEQLKHTMNQLKVEKADQIELLNFKNKYEEFLMKHKKPVKRGNSNSQLLNMSKKHSKFNGSKQLKKTGKNRNTNSRFLNYSKDKENIHSPKNLKDFEAQFNKFQFKKYSGNVKFTSFGRKHVNDPTDLGSVGWEL